MTLEQLAARRGLPLHRAADRSEQALQLARHVAAALNQVLATAPSASLALSGGRSPQAFLCELDRQPVDWQRVRITLVDERWVPLNDSQSNAGMLRRCLPTVLATASWHGLYQGTSPEADAEDASRVLASWLPLDVVVLGMGTDGHCASLFPGQPGLERRLETKARPLCEAVVGPGEQLRLTLTGGALRTARLQLLAISGDDKYQRLCAAFEGQATTWPVAAFLAPPLEIFYSPEG